jgi:signal peptidase I
MQTKKLNPFIALFLTVVIPGLGHIYIGRWRKGIPFFFAGYLLLFIYSISGIEKYYGFIIFLIITIGWYLFVITDAVVWAIKIKVIKPQWYNRWYIYLGVIITITGFSIYAEDTIMPNIIGLRSYSIPSGSMQPTLLVGDYVLVNCYYYNKIFFQTTPQRGDVVVFLFPPEPSKDHIKRVVGLPGDWVQIINKQLYINGHLLETPQAIYTDNAVLPPPATSAESSRDHYGPVVVPEDNYLVLGDNRDHSYDSRFWGFVPGGCIRGKALFIYFSRDRTASQVRWGRLGQLIN